MRIRAATEADVPRLVEMATNFLVDTPYGQLFPSNPTQIEQLVRLVLNLGVGLVADANTCDACLPDLVGMLGVVLLPHPLTGHTYAEEVVWWVQPERRNGIVGPQLLGAAEEWATRNGANMLKLAAPADSPVGKYLAKLGYIAVETAFIKPIAPIG